jgi:Domain of unknown function (DUF6458)
MGIPVSIVLIAVGAVLAFAVHQNDPNPPVDVDVVGWVLLLVGLFGLLLSLLLWERWGPGQLGWHRGYATAPPPPADYPPRRAGYPQRGRTVVEEEEGPATGGPPPP